MSYAPGARDAVVFDGGILDLSKIAPLTADEKTRLGRVELDLNRPFREKAAEQRKQYEEKRIRELKAKGVSEEVAKRKINAALEMRELPPEWGIQLDDGRIVTPHEILADPKSFHGLTCADPIDHDYRGGINLGKIYCKNFPYYIHSFAHGEARYSLGVPFANLEEEEGTSPSEHAEAEWPEPLDIFGDVSPANLANPPAGSLPGVIERWSRNEASRKGVSVGFASMAALTVCASAIGNALKIRGRIFDEGWEEPACIWGVLVADPGRAKSPIIRAAVEPLRKYDARKWKEGKVAHDAWFARTKRKGRGGVDPGPEPLIQRVLVDDATLEKQVQIHAQNPKGLLRAPDELLSLLGSLGAYKKGSDGDRSQMLRLFEGASILIDRVGSGSVRAESALMSLIAGTQPEKIAKLAKDLGSDGMLQRFLFVMDDGADRRGVDQPQDRVAKQEYEQMVTAFLELDEKLSGGVVPLTPDSYKVIDDAVEKFKTLGDSPGASTALKGHLEKWGKMLRRLVLVFHAIEQWSAIEIVDASVPVDSQTAEKAVLFASFLLRHSVRFYETFFDPSTQENDARWIAGHILTKPELTEVSRRLIYDARKDLRSDNRRLLSAMRVLENVGWLRVIARDADGPKRWLVNPVVHERFHERGKREKADRDRKREAIKKGAETKAWLNRDKMSERGEK